MSVSNKCCYLEVSHDPSEIKTGANDAANTALPSQELITF